MFETLKKVLEDTFSNLNNPDQIAELCRQRQIQGFINNETSSPMVKLVREQVDFGVSFTIGKTMSGGVWWCFNKEYELRIPSPQVCSEFTQKFNNEEYPDLIAFR